MQVCDVIVKNQKGEVINTIKDVEAPDDWDMISIRTAATKYLAQEDEGSIFNMINRVASSITENIKYKELKDMYEAMDNWEKSFIDKGVDIEEGTLSHMFTDKGTFKETLRQILLDRLASFNSPVWFNLGVEENPMISACFILGLEDNMESILKSLNDAGMVYTNGGGTGCNWSVLRPAHAPLSKGGQASGPLSFFKAHDRLGGVIKSGGKTRRSAHMAILNNTHADCSDFVDYKKIEEEKMLDLLNTGKWGDASDFENEAAETVSGQNANFSVRMVDDFMKRVESDELTDKEKDLWDKIIISAHACGDPGLQFDDNINKHNPFDLEKHPEMKFNASNPCSEFMFMDNSACNLSSINLHRLEEVSETTDELYQSLIQISSMMTFCMDTLVDMAFYPTKEIEANSHKYRPLGLGFTGLGALLMQRGIPYDSDRGRNLAATITKVMTESAFLTSHCIANVRDVHGIDPQRIKENYFRRSDVDNKYTRAMIHQTSYVNSFANAQVTLLAPCGTIGLQMNSISSGIEPLMAPVSYKFMAGGGTEVLPSPPIESAIITLVMKENLRAYLNDYLDYFHEHNKIHPDIEDYPVFQTALGSNPLSPEAHIDMMAAVQPYLTGAISKTVNMPEHSTKEDVSHIYRYAYKRNLKAVAIYRDGSKNSQPVKTSNEELVDPIHLGQRALDNERSSLTHEFEIGGVKCFLTCGYYPDGNLGEIFLQVSSSPTLKAMHDAWAIGVSMGLQRGVPFEAYFNKFASLSYEPGGFTNNSDIPTAPSIIGYVMRYIKKRALRLDKQLLPSGDTEVKSEKVFSRKCPECGSGHMIKNGICYTCPNCGFNDGGCGG